MDNDEHDRETRLQDIDCNDIDISSFIPFIWESSESSSDSSLESYSFHLMSTNQRTFYRPWRKHGHGVCSTRSPLG